MYLDSLLRVGSILQQAWRPGHEAAAYIVCGQEAEGSLIDAQLTFFLFLTKSGHQPIRLCHSLRVGPSSPGKLLWQHPHAYLEVCLSGELQSWQADSEDDPHIYISLHTHVFPYRILDSAKS